MVHNDLHDTPVVEPFAGGAGASLRLMFAEVASEIVLNDLDRRMYAFWRAVVNQTDELVDRIRNTPVTMKQWRASRAIYDAPIRGQHQLDLAHAVFFLNRCNRSGIVMGGGPIGGYKQKGEWKLGARFNRANLIERIMRIARYRDRIQVSCFDARKLLTNLAGSNERKLVFLDPPYYRKGQRLYFNALDHEDHEELAALLLGNPPFNWVLTYDNTAPIRKLFESVKTRPFRLSYSAYERRVGRELLIIDPRLKVPSRIIGRHIHSV